MILLNFRESQSIHTKYTRKQAADEKITRLPKVLRMWKEKINVQSTESAIIVWWNGVECTHRKQRIYGDE